MNKDEILKIIKSELSQAIGGDGESSIESNRLEALDYYHGTLPKKVGSGRSGIVSTDVADAIEWILPQIIKALTQTNEVVTFDPTGEGDEEQAQLESEYVYSVLMKENPGFLILYSFVKDMLLQKNGIIKTYYDDDKEESVEPYTGINEFQYQGILSSPEVELLEQTILETEVGLVADIKIKRTKDNGKVIVLPVPPEEFRVNSDHNSPNIENARFVAHVSSKTASDLIEMGIDRKIVENLPTYTDEEEDRFSAQGEYSNDEAENPSQRLIEVAECYLKLDMDNTGVASLQKVTVAAEKTILSIEEVDEHPLISATGIIMPHKWAGLSIYDRLKEIQDQKTSLIRNIFDNIYLQNNGRTVAGKGVNLDDLMVNRPGGIIRADDINQLREYKSAPLGAEAFGLLDKLSEISSGRSGVSPESMGQNHMVGTDTAHGIERLMTAKEELVGLIVRVVAETGLKPLCLRIRELLRRHVDSVQEFKFRNQWMQLNPSQWGDRSRVSVRVGLGSGDKQNQLNAMSQVLMYQEKILANPDQTMVEEVNVFSALNDFSKLAGLTAARSYFTDPESNEGKQRQARKQRQGEENRFTEKQLQIGSIQAQNQLAIAETKKAEAAQANVTLKAEIDRLKLRLQDEKQNSDAQIDYLETRLKQAENGLKQAKEAAEMQFKYDKLATDVEAKQKDQLLKEREIEVKEAQFLAEQAEEANILNQLNNDPQIN